MSEIAAVRRPGVRRAAITTAIAWLVLGTALELIVSRAPHPGALIPQLLAVLAVVIGWPLGRWAGRRNGLQARGDWARMWAGTFGLMFLVFGFVACGAAIAMYG